MQTPPQFDIVFCMSTPQTSINAQDVFIQQKISQFESSVHQTVASLRNARSIMDVVRAHRGLPTAPSLISWSNEIRRARGSADLALARAAKEVVSNELKRLDDLFSRAEQDAFQRSLGNFRRDLRYLGPIASPVMHHASVHIHTHYRLRKTEVPCDVEGLSLYAVSLPNPSDRITESDLTRGEVLFQKQFSAQPKVGGRIYAGMRLHTGGVLTLEVHGGRGSFVVRDESRALSQQFTFGSLRDCVLEFERRAGVVLPDIRVFEPGVGVWEAHQMYAQGGENPWRLDPGQQYEVTSPGGTTRRYLVNDDETVTQVNTDGAYAIHPRHQWGETEWMSLRKIEQTEQETPRERE